MVSLQTWHELVPFDQKNFPFTVQACVELSEAMLCVSFQILGDQRGITFAAPVLEPQRLDELSLKTCFEIFVQPAGASEYWEWNFAPSGDWQCYHLDGERQNRLPEQRIESVILQAGPDGPWRFEVFLGDLNLSEHRPLNCGLTAVIVLESGEKTYWALKHTAQRPDFHKKESYILEFS